ncbi:antigen-presenting glycoprotein CD1d-like isoform X1 [Chrysemys picta bellii]|uniref:antigen-presenting glycoprotein CD1d-like isoform X1 n=1 Tax=Chrysemys picta bellii TaxID=8478 RepID=UPI0032B273CE
MKRHNVKSYENYQRLIYIVTSGRPSSSPALPVPDPFVTQFSIGCELPPNGTSRGFYDVGVNGEDFISFDVDGGKWVTRQRDKLALYAQDLLNQDKGAARVIQFFLRITCVNLTKSFVQHGKESLERQERPVAVVFARAPPSAGTPAPVLLVCRVTGFYPRPVRVAWLQDGEEVGPGGRLNSSGILPNADLTYQLRSSLAVGPGAGHSYACRVQHSSLGGRSLLIPWEQALGPRAGRGHHPGGCGRSRRGRGAVAEQTQVSPPLLGVGVGALHPLTHPLCSLLPGAARVLDQGNPGPEGSGPAPAWGSAPLLGI